jgi:hypothetical protein
MKYVIRTVVVCVLLGLVAWAMSYISSDGNSIKLNSDWGIAKDRLRK